MKLKFKIKNKQEIINKINEGCWVIDVEIDIIKGLKEYQKSEDFRNITNIVFDTERKRFKLYGNNMILPEKINEEFFEMLEKNIDPFGIYEKVKFNEKLQDSVVEYFEDGRKVLTIFHNGKCGRDYISNFETNSLDLRKFLLDNFSKIDNWEKKYGGKKAVFMLFEFLEANKFVDCIEEFMEFYC